MPIQDGFIMDDGLAMSPSEQLNANQEVFVDAFGQQSTSSVALPKLQDGARTSARFSEQMHAVMNVAAVLVIVSFVALQRNSAIDLARIFL